MSDKSLKSTSMKPQARSSKLSTKSSDLSNKGDGYVDSMLAELKEKNIHAEQPNTSFYKDMKWDWCITGSLYLRQIIFEKLFPPIEGVNIDRLEFIDLFAWSFSLSIPEKSRVIDSWPTLSQDQCDALRETFINERMEFGKLLDRERDTVHGLLLNCMMDWVYIVYGDTRVAAATAIESFQSEAFGIEYLPFPREFFKRDENFYVKLTVILLRIGAQPEIWKASMRQAERRRNAKPASFWRDMLQALQDSPNSVNQMRNILIARIYAGENAIETTEQDDEFKYRTIIAQGRSYLNLKDDEHAIKCFTDAYHFAVSKFELKPEKKNIALNEILEAKAFALHPWKKSEIEDFFHSSIWSDIPGATLDLLFQRLSCNFLFIGQGRLALQLFQDHLDANDDATGKSFDMFSIAMYIGEFSVADDYVSKHEKNEVQPKISEFLEIMENGEPHNPDRHFAEASKQSFILWMHYICAPSDALKDALDKIYGHAYKKWLTREYLKYSDNNDWSTVFFGLTLQNICNDMPAGTDQLINTIKYNRARLFVIDNLYVASGFCARRGDLSKIRLLSRVAKEVYSMGGKNVLGQNMPLIERFEAFAEQGADDMLLYAGHPEEVKRFEGTWTLERFRQRLPPP